MKSLGRERGERFLQHFSILLLSLLCESILREIGRALETAEKISYLQVDIVDHWII